MNKIEKTGYGFKLTFGDTIDKAEMTQWVADGKKALVGNSGDFGCLIDMRTLKPLAEDVQPVMQEGQKAFKEKGMQRSAVIVGSAMQAMQFKRIGKETGIYKWERYVSSDSANYENVALAWIKDGTDPDA